MKYRKKPVVIEAVQWNGYPSTTMIEHLGGGIDFDPGSRQMVIDTREGQMRANVGDWIIKGVKGEFYPIKDVIFRETYDLVD